MHQKLVPNPFLTLWYKLKQPLQARNSFKSMYFERGLSKTLLMNKVIKNRRGLELVTVTLQVTKQVQKNSFICYKLSDHVWWCNVKQFLSYSKNYNCKFMQANPWHHKLFHFLLSFWIWKVWKGREKFLNILRTKRAF